MFDVEKIRADFPMFQNHPELVYFDNAATTYKPQSVMDAVLHVYTHETSNVHRGDYDLSAQISDDYEQARHAVKRFINAKSEKEIVFTAGASMSLNQVAYGYGLTHLTNEDVILTTQAEHASGILPWFKVAEKTGAKVAYIPLSQEGVVDLKALQEKLSRGRVKIVTLAYVSNVLGHIQPLKEIVRLSHEAGAVVVVDGAQSVPHIVTDVQEVDVDFLSFSSHKMLGPSGVGILYGKKELLDETEPFLYGGGSNARFTCDGSILLKETPYKFEAGTPAIEAVVGLKAAIEYLEKIGMEAIQRREEELRRYLMQKLSKLDNLHIYNPTATTGIVAFNVKGVFAQDAASFLNTKHIAVRSGNHCAKVLVDLIGTNETVRASLYFYNTFEEIDRFVEACSEITLENCIDFLF